MIGTTIPKYLLIPMFMGALLATTTRASLPDDRTSVYSLHENAGDETSPVQFRIHLDVTSVDSNGPVIAWEPVEARFELINTSGEIEAVWTAAWPELDTQDGYWWVTHADTKDPQPGEFNNLPLLFGLAISNKSSNPDLNYELASLPCDGTCEFMYSGSVTAMTYSLWTEYSTSGAEVDEEGEDEPTEIDEDGAPPST